MPRGPRTAVCVDRPLILTLGLRARWLCVRAVVSPWHDMPLELEGGLYNMLTEIPKMTFKKMEVDTKAEGNPIKQDEKKGKARLYHGPIFWNYGCLPQTWEDPNVKGDADVGGAFGDDDPVDVVEIGAGSLAMGSFTPVKVLGCLSMIDDGELDWKVCARTRRDAHAHRLTRPASLHTSRSRRPLPLLAAGHCAEEGRRAL